MCGRSTAAAAERGCLPRAALQCCEHAACTLCLPQSCRHPSLPRLPLIHAPAPLPCLQIQRSREGKRVGRLYVTDGSMPDYVVQQYPRSAPGAVLCSAVRGAARGGAGRGRRFHACMQPGTQRPC